MSVIVPFLLLGFIVGGGVFLLRYDRPEGAE